MKLQSLPAHIPILIWDDFYTEQELDLLWKEIIFLTDKNKFKRPEETNAATINGEYLKSAAGIWIDNVYVDRNTSNILKCNRKIFSTEFITKAKIINPLYCILENIDLDQTLLNYYENNDGYKKHKDSSVFTAITMLVKNEENFTGGELILHEYDLSIGKRNNRLVLFPGNLEHSVTPIQMQIPHTAFGGDGRYTITQFMTVK